MSGKKLSPLEEAHRVVFESAFDEERKYGDFRESMKHACEIFNTITKNNLTVEEYYIALVSLKIQREMISHKEDNIMDLAAYWASMGQYTETRVSDYTKRFPNVDY